MKKSILLLFVLTPFCICLAQKDKAINLKLEKKIPLYVGSDRLNKCGISGLLLSLRDSLTKEGFKLVDSAESKSMHRAFERDVLPELIRSKPGDTMETIKARVERATSTKKILQELTIQSTSCFDTLHSYTITLYLFPRPRTDEKKISFTLPFNSPYRISDIILSLIEREPPKK